MPVLKALVLAQLALTEYWESMQEAQNAPVAENTGIVGDSIVQVVGTVALAWDMARMHAAH